VLGDAGDPRHGEGYDVYVVTDASGGVSVEAHDMAIRRLVAAGAQPITWLAMAGELQRDWARIQYLGDVAKIFAERAGATVRRSRGKRSCFTPAKLSALRPRIGGRTRGACDGRIHLTNPSSARRFRRKRSWTPAGRH